MDKLLCDGKHDKRYAENRYSPNDTKPSGNMEAVESFVKERIGAEEDGSRKKAGTCHLIHKKPICLSTIVASEKSNPKRNTDEILT